MTQREHEAIRYVLNALRTDNATVAKVLTYMTSKGFSAEETQKAVNAIAERGL